MKQLEMTFKIGLNVISNWFQSEGHENETQLSLEIEIH